MSADRLRKRNVDFTRFGFPVDVLWSDIQWAQQYGVSDDVRYFEFNPANFTTDSLSKLHDEVEAAHRRLTVIIDPHIKVADDYWVHNEGMELQL